MTRAMFQVLVIPHRVEVDGTVEYGLLRRSEEDGGYWQWVAGGGEAGETPLDAAIREGFEEAGIPLDSHLIRLDAVASIPISELPDFADRTDIHVVSEYSFGVRVDSRELRLSDEHTAFRWASYADALAALHWDSNKTALWELNRRLAASP